MSRHCLQVGEGDTRQVLTHEIAPALDPEPREVVMRAGRIDVLLKLLRLKFGPVPAPVRAQIEAASVKALDAMAGRVLSATELAEVVPAEP